MGSRIIEFIFRGDSRDLDQVLDKTKRQAKEAKAETKGLGDALGGLGRIVAGGAVLAFLKGVTTDAFAAGEAVADMAQRTGISAEALSGLSFAARQTETSLQSIQLGMKGLSSAISDGLIGKPNEAGDALRSLGIATTDATGAARPMESVLLDVADVLSRMEDGAVKAALAQQVFGRAGQDLIPLLNEGRSGIEALTRRAGELGLVWSNEAAAGAEKFGDQVDEAKAAMRGLVQEAVRWWIPKLTELSRALGLTQEGGAPSDKIQRQLEQDRKALRRLFAERDELQRQEREGGASAGLTAEIADVDAEIDRVKANIADAKQALAGLQEQEATLAAEAQKTADAYVAERKALEGAAEAAKAQAVAEKEAADAAAERQRLAESVAGIGLTPIEEIRRQLADQRALLAEAREEEILTEQEHAARLVQIQAEAAEQIRALDEQRVQAFAENRERETFLEQDSAQRRGEIEAESNDSTISGGQQVTGALLGFVEAVTAAHVAGTEEQSEERRAALKEQFRVNKIAAIAQAGVNTALAISNAFGSAPNPIVGGVLAAVAAVVGALQIAAIAAQPAPSFHRGGMVGDGLIGLPSMRSGTLSADEGLARVLRNEAVLSGQGVAAAGGREGVDRLNRGERGAREPIVVVSVTNNRTTDVQTHEQLRRYDSPLATSIRATRSRPVGSHQVWPA